jgi:hypothetical protein
VKVVGLEYFLAHMYFFYNLRRTEASEFKMHAPVFVGKGVGEGMVVFA